MASCCLRHLTNLALAFFNQHPILPLWLQSGAIHMALGGFAEGAAQYEAALEVAPAHPAVLLGAAESLAAAAGMHARQGALGAWAGEVACVHIAWRTVPSCGAGAEQSIGLIFEWAPAHCSLPCHLAAGTAADELARAATHILRCTAKHGTLQAGA